MASITVKNIPEPLYERLKLAAQVNRRSVNSEIILSIERSVLSQRLDVDAFLADARRLRERTGQYQISEEEFNEAKQEGRL